MAGNARKWVKIVLKSVNCMMGIVGIAMLLYGFWMVRVWKRDVHAPSFRNSTSAWFIYAFLGIGAALCGITCQGHIAADSANGCCLSCYVVIISSLLLLEAAVIADVLLNSDWQKDFPEDETGKFSDFQDFVKSNFDYFKWIGFFIVFSQGLAVLLAMLLRSLEPNHESNYKGGDDYTAARVPLINHHVQVQPSSYVIGEPFYASKSNI